MKGTIHNAMLAIAVVAIASTTFTADAADAADSEATYVPAEFTLDSDAWREYWHGAMRAELTSAVRALADDAADAVVADGRESIGRGGEEIAAPMHERVSVAEPAQAVTAVRVPRNPG
jgi:uncharacterized protein YfaQ (DUF2300 family)